jgi:hypothetical protein
MYEKLTVHQRISLKGLFTSAKERRDIGVKDDVGFQALHGVMVMFNFKVAIEYYLTDNINLLYSHMASEQSKLF